MHHVSLDVHNIEEIGQKILDDNDQIQKILHVLHNNDESNVVFQNIHNYYHCKKNKRSHLIGNE
jgi:hypothetical protein